MGVVVFLFLMGRVHMLMGTVFLPAVVVPMHMLIPGMLMPVGMLVEVLMGVGVRMLVAVHLVAVVMLMVVLVGVFVGMQVLVFVFAFHGWSLPGNFWSLAKVSASGAGRAPPTPYLILI